MKILYGVCVYEWWGVGDSINGTKIIDSLACVLMKAYKINRVAGMGKGCLSSSQ